MEIQKSNVKLVSSDDDVLDNSERKVGLSVSDKRMQFETRPETNLKLTHNFNKLH